MESHRVCPFGLAVCALGLGFYCYSAMIPLAGRELQASICEPLGEDTLQEPEASEGHERGVHGLILKCLCPRRGEETK